MKMTEVIPEAYNGTLSPVGSVNSKSKKMTPVGEVAKIAAQMKKENKR